MTTTTNPSQAMIDTLLALVETACTTFERNAFHGVYERAVGLHGHERAVKIALSALNLGPSIPDAIATLQSRPQCWA